MTGGPEPSDSLVERSDGADALDLETPQQPRCSETEPESHDEGQLWHQQQQVQQQVQEQRQAQLPLSTTTTTTISYDSDPRTLSQPSQLPQHPQQPGTVKTSLNTDVTQHAAAAVAASPTTSAPTSINLSPITAADADADILQRSLPFVAPSHYLRRQRSSGDTHTSPSRNRSPTQLTTEPPHSGPSGSIADIIHESATTGVGREEQLAAVGSPSGEPERGRDNRGGGIGWILGREKEEAEGRGRAAVARKMSPMDSEQHEGLRIIRAFLKVRTSYDVLPLSFRLIVFDTALLVKKSLNILIQNGIVSAPLWDSKTSTFAGLLTVSDYINVIQYYVQNPDSLSTIDQFRLNSLRDIEKAIGVQPLETISAHPMQPLYTACRRMLESRARRIPLVDVDDETNRSMVVSVVTQYRILKFVAVNVKETQMLRKRLGDIRCVTSDGLQTARMETSVMDVIQIFVKYSISSVPILDDEGALVNVFEAVDVIALIKGGVYDDLNLTVGEALLKRSDDFPGIFTCTLNDRLDSIFDTIRKSRVHRFVVIDEDKKLIGLLTLSDILEYILLEGVDEDKD